MKRILITGAGSGLGKELSKCYGDKESHVILVGRNKDKLEKATMEIIKNGGSAEYMVCDISSATSVNRLVREVYEKHRSIDCLINNAGIGFFGSIEKISIEEINTMIDTNVKGTIMVTQGLLPYVNYRILNIISTAGLKGKVNESVYVASKFAVRGFTESLQKELIGSEVKVTAVYMGGMNTPFWKGSTHIKDNSRLTSPEEVAREIKLKDDGRNEIIIDK